MKFLEWHNECVGDYDVFMVVYKDEAQKIVQHFDTELALSCTTPSATGVEQYFYFLNTKLKTITPMPILALAFSCQYNGYPPYGEDIDKFEFTLEDYKLSSIKRIK